MMDQNRVLEEAAATDKLIKEQLQNELNNLRNTEQVRDRILVLVFDIMDFVFFRVTSTW